jgi:phospholipid/cholesterol/gamma-HCH transport system substrate-binding protein
LETRANYALIGLFTLAVILGAFSFAYYYIGAGHKAARKTYIVHFDGSVSGLANGASVLFDGLKVGEVTELSLLRESPNRVYARISVEASTPVRVDTRASLEFGGLTGVAWVALEGGSAEAAPLPEYGVLLAQPSGMQGLLKKAQALSVKADDFLDRANRILDENSPMLKTSLTNFQTFTGALADSSDNFKNAMNSVDPAKVRSIVDNVDKSAAKINVLLGDSKGKAMIGDISDAARSIRKLAESLTRFADTGLREYGPLAAEGRRTLQTIDHAVRFLEQNPQSLIFGAPSPPPPVSKGR